MRVSCWTKRPVDSPNQDRYLRKPWSITGSGHLSGKPTSSTNYQPIIEQCPVPGIATIFPRVQYGRFHPGTPWHPVAEHQWPSTTEATTRCSTSNLVRMIIAVGANPLFQIVTTGKSKTSQRVSI